MTFRVTTRHPWSTVRHVPCFDAIIFDQLYAWSIDATTWAEPNPNTRSGLPSLWFEVRL